MGLGGGGVGLGGGGLGIESPTRDGVPLVSSILVLLPPSRGGRSGLAIPDPAGLKVAA